MPKGMVVNLSFGLIGRLIHVLIRYGLAIVLFSSITFRPLFAPATSSEEIQDGIAKFNVLAG